MNSPEFSPAAKLRAERERFADEPLLLQHKYGGDDALTPWRVLVVTIMLQRTRGEQADAAIPELFTHFPTPEELAEAPFTLEYIIEGCGLVKTRARVLRHVSDLYNDWLWEHEGEGFPGTEEIENWKGVGRYTAEAYDLVVFDNWDSWEEPQDTRLRVYWRWRDGLKKT